MARYLLVLALVVLTIPAAAADEADAGSENGTPDQGADAQGNSTADSSSSPSAEGNTTLLPSIPLVCGVNTNPTVTQTDYRVKQDLTGYVKVKEPVPGGPEQQNYIIVGVEYDLATCLNEILGQG